MEYTQTELRIMALFAAIGAVFSWLIGGIDGMGTALLVFIVIDYVSGMTAAWITGQVSSNKGFEGIKRKIVMLVIVVVAHWLDVASNQHNTFKAMVIFAYLGNEGISICENLDRMGYGKYIPELLRSKLIQLRNEKIEGDDKK